MTKKKTAILFSIFTPLEVARRFVLSLGRRRSRLRLPASVTKRIMVGLLTGFILLAIFGATGFVYAVGYEIPFPTAVERAAAGEGMAGYVNRLYIYALGLVGLTALGAMIFGGVLYTASAGNPSLQGDAKKRIYSALIGLGILLTSYMILYTINPDLVNLRNPSMGSVIDATAPKLGAAGKCQDSTQCGAGYTCQGYIANVSDGTCVLSYVGKCENNDQCGKNYECKAGKCVFITNAAEACPTYLKKSNCEFAGCKWTAPAGVTEVSADETRPCVAK